MSDASEQGIVQERKSCVNGCGFYGSAATSDMCSKCWRDTISQQQQQLMETPRKEMATGQAPSASTLPLEPLSPFAQADGAASASAASEQGASSSASVSGAPSLPAGGPLEGGFSTDDAAALVAMVVDGETAGAEGPEAEPVEPAQKNRKRCFSCNKKVGLTGIECRCKLVFCGVHRYPEQHGCQFDFKTVDRANLAQTVKGGGQFAKVDRL